MKIVYIVYLSFLVLFYSQNLFASIENKIVLKVENQIITNFEVKNKILTLLVISNQEINQNNINNLKKDVLNLLINSKIKKIEISKYNIKQDNVKIEAYINSIYTDVSDLKKKFSENNLDYQLFFDEIAVELMWQELIYKIYSKKIDINKNLIESEIKDYIKNASLIEEFRISEIEIPFSNKEELEIKTLNIEKEIKAMGFEQTALKYNNKYSNSSNIDLGWISAYALAPEIYERLSEINVGEITQPIIGQNNIMILKLSDKRIAKKENVDTTKLREEFFNKKRNDQFRLYSKSHLSKLKNNSLIEYK
jgi:peptidyl-prolyl cis-trans isomerase SurA